MASLARLAATWRRCTGPRGRDIAVVAISGLGSIASSTIATWASHRPALGVLILLSGLIGSTVLWWRRRWPVLVTLIGAAFDLVGAGPLVLGFGLLTMAVRRRDRLLVTMTALAAVCFSVPSPFESTGWQLSSLISGTIAAIVWSLFGAYVGARRDLLESLRDRAVRGESERELRAEQARIAERARIAREMHDVLAHKVSLIALQAGALEVNPAQDAQSVERAASQIRITARDTLEDLRGVLGVLRGSGDGIALAPQPGLADLPRLVDESVGVGVQVRLRIDVAASEVTEVLGRTIYRVVQEGLTNVHKHARGAGSQVRVIRENDGITATVTNQRPVAAGSLLPGSGSGLVGLRERVALAGGTLTAGPTVDGGWQVSAWLPLPITAAVTTAPTTPPTTPPTTAATTPATTAATTAAMTARSTGSATAPIGSG